MTKHTSSCIIYDDTWSSLYCYFDRKENEWIVRIQINLKYFNGKGSTLQAAVLQVQHKINTNDCEKDMKDFLRGDNKPIKPNVVNIATEKEEKIEDLF